MPGELTWWIWLATATLLALGLAGHDDRSVVCAHRAVRVAQPAIRDFPVQVRLTFSSESAFL
jgi:hypothetical protein